MDDIVERLRGTAYATPNEAWRFKDRITVAANEIERLRAELERTRQAWVDGEDPMCDDVCRWACKGPCGVSQ